MKLTLAVLIGLLITSPVLAQEDLSMFETPEAENCPTCRAKMPNVGKDAKNVDSVKIVPALPSVDVSMDQSNDDVSRPFTGRKMKHQISDSDNLTSSHSADLTKPVDFSAQGGKEIKIVSVKEKAVKKEVAEEEKENAPKKNKKDENIGKKSPAAEKLQAKADQIAMQQLIARQQHEKVIHQAEKFDIAGIRLGMQPEDVIETAAESGFELVNAAYGIPSFMITDFERECRSSGLYQTRLIHECIRETARENDVYYISQLVFKRSDSKEEITVLFSSVLTDNKVFKVDYTAFGDNSLGTSYKDLLKKTNRRDIFWKYVFDKYGRPAQKDNLFWGAANGVYMRAFLQGNSLDGRIVLEDTAQKGIDYGEAEKRDMEKDINNPFNF